MDWIIFGFIVAWLGIISWFDIRKNEIPHSAWVIIPLIGAGVYRVWQGDWSLVLLATLVAAVSERERLSHVVKFKESKRIITWFPLLFLSAYLAIPSFPIAGLAIVGFWVAWELKWWGGADAVAAITLILIYPGLTFILAFLVVHIIVTIGLFIRSLMKEKSVKMHRMPGLPLLLLAIFIYQITQYCFIPF
jgi:hypothetical protein